MFTRGDRIGRYTIDRLLGEGGMGAAYLAHHEAMAGFKKKVVVKVLQQDKATDPVNVELFLREARVGGRLNHTSIVQIFDIGEERGAHFMAMEYVDGITLLQATRRCWTKGRGIPMDIAVRVIAMAAEGLHYAHTFKHHNGTEAGVVHRDLSPDNLMIAREGTVKVLDFGVARIGGSEATKSGDLKGKIPYMPPEQIMGDVDIDARADLYALAVTLYWCLCGRRPFMGDIASMMRAITREAPPMPRSFNPDVPPALEALIMQLLEKDRSKRIASAQLLAEELARFVAPNSGSNDKVLAAFVASVDDIADPVGRSVQGRPASVGAVRAIVTGETPANTEQVPPLRLEDATHELAPVTLSASDLESIAGESAAPATISTARGHATVDEASQRTVRLPHTPRGDASLAYVAVAIAVAVAIGTILLVALLSSCAELLR